MTVERVGNNEAGYGGLVLSCNQYIQNGRCCASSRQTWSSTPIRGFVYPSDAVRVEDGGQTGVYVLEGATARWKLITILHDNGESYVVELDKTPPPPTSGRATRSSFTQRIYMTERLGQMSTIAENIRTIRETMAGSRTAGRARPSEIRLCAATKMNDAAAVRAAIEAGVDCCGENRVQEIRKSTRRARMKESRCTSSGICRRTRSNTSLAW